MHPRVLVAFEGGGAKGLAHVGAIKALEGAEAEITAVAGTSAGAIAAALLAAGYRADELINPGAGKALGGVVQPGPAFARGLFGPVGWRSIALFRWISGFGPAPLILAAVALFWLVVSAPGLVWGWSLASVAAGVGAAVVVILFLGFMMLRGLADLDTFRDGLNGLLAVKVKPADDDGLVRFRDFARLQGPGLKIVATDITARRRHVFSPETTPHVVVAEAVAASACLPLVFGPRRVDRGLFFDGGFVSNLPVWLFDAERVLDLEAVTIAVSLADNGGAQAPGRFTWPVPLLRTAIFGREFLNTRAIGRLRPVTLPVDIGVLDFDVSAERVYRLVEVATKEASSRIRADLFETPRVFRKACEEVRALAEDAIGLLPEEFFADPTGAPHVRVAVAMPEASAIAEIDGEPRYLRLQHAAGFDGYPDEGLTLPLKGSVMGAVWQSAKPGDYHLELIKVVREEELEHQTGPYSLQGPANRLRRQLVWPDLAWVLAVPISLVRDGKTVDLVLSIDGNHVLRAEALEADLQGFFSDLAEAVQRMFPASLATSGGAGDDGQVPDDSLPGR